MNVVKISIELIAYDWYAVFEEGFFVSGYIYCLVKFFLQVNFTNAIPTLINLIIKPLQ